MDEYLSEKEQIEQIKEWWRENGWYLIGGALLAGLGYLGYNQYRAYQDRVAEEAAAIYLDLGQLLEDDDYEQADALLARLVDDYPSSPYTSHARLLFASEYVVNDAERAIAYLADVVEQSEDPELVQVARLRLARVLAYDEQYERALEVLSVGDAGGFAARFSEVRGDIYAAMGDTDAAVTAYTEALLGAGSEGLNREFLQLKLSEVLPDEAPTGSAAESPAVSPPETQAESPPEAQNESPAESPSEGPTESTTETSAETEAEEGE